MPIHFSLPLASLPKLLRRTLSPLWLESFQVAARTKEKGRLLAAPSKSGIRWWGLAPPSVAFLYYLMPWIMINTGALTRETTETSLIRMFIVGPEVSLKGSPTVSPTTAAL